MARTGLATYNESEICIKNMKHGRVCTRIKRYEESKIKLLQSQCVMEDSKQQQRKQTMQIIHNTHQQCQTWSNGKWTAREREPKSIIKIQVREACSQAGTLIDDSRNTAWMWRAESRCQSMDDFNEGPPQPLHEKYVVIVLLPMPAPVCQREYAWCFVRRGTCSTGQLKRGGGAVPSMSWSSTS